MDIRALPKLEGTVHANMALVLKFLPSYLLQPTALPDVLRRRDAAVVVYGQLVLEQAALTELDRDLVDQMFDVLVRDFSAYAVDLHSKTSSPSFGPFWPTSDRCWASVDPISHPIWRNQSGPANGAHLDQHSANWRMSQHHVRRTLDGAGQPARPRRLQMTTSPDQGPTRHIYDAVDLAERLSRFEDRWSPKVVARFNDYEVKVVKAAGEFVWHSHDDTDELFLVLDGSLTIELRDGAVTLGPGSLFVVPRGVEHHPVASGEVHALLIEPRGVVNTGDAGGPLTSAYHEMVR